MQLSFQHGVIESLGYALAPEVWTSEDIEARLAPAYERLKLPAGRLELMTGIRERRFWPASYKPSVAAAEAAENTLAASQLARQDIELLIFAGVCRDQLEPATAANVHRLLELSPACQVIDLSNACLGFCNAMSLAAGLIDAGNIRRALIVSGENGRPLMDWTLGEMLRADQTRQSIKGYFANLTIGAGAVAATLCHESVAPGRVRLRGGATLTDSSASQLCEGGTAGDNALAMMTDSEALLKAGVNLARQTWDAFTEATGWTGDQLDGIVCHQVGKQHQRALLERLNLPLELDYPTYPELGNVGSVSLPLTLARALEAQAFTSGSKVAGLGIGSGLGCMMLAFEVL